MSNLSLSSDTFNLFPAAPASFLLRFERMPYLSFVVQEVALPGISAVAPQVALPGVNVRYQPDRLTYEPLQVTFLVDEEFRVHRELHQWLAGMTGRDDRSTLTAAFVNDQAEFVWGTGPATSGKRLAETSRTTAGLTIVNESKIPILRVLFYNLYPTAVGPVQFSVTVDPLTTLTSTATFEYDFYSIVEIRR